MHLFLLLNTNPIRPAIETMQLNSVMMIWNVALGQWHLVVYLALMEFLYIWKVNLQCKMVKLALISVALFKLIVATNCFTFSSISDVLSYKTLDVSRVFFFSCFLLCTRVAHTFCALLENVYYLCIYIR